MRLRIFAAVGLTLVCAAGDARTHFSIVLPRTAATRRGDPVEVVYRWGHPFEHQLFDAAAPQSWFVLAPDATRLDLVGSSDKARGVKSPLEFRATFIPKVRGDYTCVLKTAPRWMEEDDVFFEDTVRVAIHVQAQKGWDVPTGLPLDFVPLTRPYGLTPGMVFQARAVADGKSLSGAVVEIERYNSRPPRELPPEEQITRTAKTDPNGVVTATLPEGGWWSLTTRRPAGVRERAGKAYPVHQRVTIWVYVDGNESSDGK